MRFAPRRLLVVVLLPLLTKTLVGADTTVQTAPKLGPPTDVVFKARIDGSEQRYVEMLPGEFDPAKSCDVLIALHGHGSDRWQYVRQERGECKAARDVAGQRGMIFISPDYRAKTSWMGPVAEADLVEIIGRLRKAYTIRKTFLVGGSMGGTGALTFAALHPNLVDGVCTQNPLASFLGYKVEAAGISAAIRASFGGTEEEKPEEYRKRSALFHAQRFTMPLAVTTGGRDRLVPAESALALAEAVKQHNPNVLIIHRPEVGHLTSYDDTKTALDFVIDKALDPPYVFTLRFQRSTTESEDCCPSGQAPGRSTRSRP